MGGPPLRGRPGPEGCAPHTLFLRGFDWEGVKNHPQSPTRFWAYPLHPWTCRPAAAWREIGESWRLKVGLGDSGLLGLRLIRKHPWRVVALLRWLTARPSAL